MADVYGYAQDPTMRAEKDGSLTDLVALDPKFRADLLPKLKVTSSGDIDLSPYCIDQNQRQMGSCAANSSVETVEMLNKVAGYKDTPLSRLFTYNLARNEEGQLAQDAGTHLRTCFDVLGRFGVCDEYIFPYEETLLHDLPPFMAMRQALGHKLQAAYRIDTIGSERLADVVAALNAKHAISFGTGVSVAFNQVSDLTPVGPPAATDVEGGHAMVIVGYLNGNFLIHNSWGTTWGAGGFCLFTPEYLTSTLTQDLWVPTLGIDFTNF